MELKDVVWIGTLMLSVGISYGIVKTMINNHEDSIKSSSKRLAELDEQYRASILELREKIADIKSIISKALDHDTAEKKFVTQRELQLHLQNIDTKIVSIEGKMKTIDNKLDTIIETLKKDG